MRERPILWSAPMVLALLAKRKTQTRRIVKPQPLMDSGPPDHWHDADAKPYARVGDRLWGRETWRTHEQLADGADGTLYRADGAFRVIDNTEEAMEAWVLADRAKSASGGKWRPGIFMPRWASRLLHEVTAVRVERLQDISAEDAIAEGLSEEGGVDVPFYGCPGVFTADFTDPRDAYRELWQSINGPESWAANPWVWAISFKPVTP